MSSVVEAYAKLPGVVRNMLDDIDTNGTFKIVEELTALGE